MEEEAIIEPNTFIFISTDKSNANSQPCEEASQKLFEDDIKMPNRQIIKNIQKKIDTELSETFDESKDENNPD